MCTNIELISTVKYTITKRRVGIFGKENPVFLSSLFFHFTCTGYKIQEYYTVSVTHILTNWLIFFILALQPVNLTKFCSGSIS